MATQISKKQRETHLRMFHKLGPDRFYHKVIGAGMIHSVETPDPEVAMLNTAEGFLYLFRRTGNEEFLLISKILRRAAHVVYRQLMRQNKEKKPNRRFIASVAG